MSQSVWMVFLWVWMQIHGVGDCWMELRMWEKLWSWLLSGKRFGTVSKRMASCFHCYCIQGKSPFYIFFVNKEDCISEISDTIIKCPPKGNNSQKPGFWLTAQIKKEKQYFHCATAVLYRGLKNILSWEILNGFYSFHSLKLFMYIEYILRQFSLSTVWHKNTQTSWSPYNKKQ